MSLSDLAIPAAVLLIAAGLALLMTSYLPRVQTMPIMLVVMRFLLAWALIIGGAWCLGAIWH